MNSGRKLSFKNYHLPLGYSNIRGVDVEEKLNVKTDTGMLKGTNVMLASKDKGGHIFKLD